MDVVGHPDLGMDGQTLPGGRLDPGPTKKPVVRVSAKEVLPVMAALNDVLRLARNDKAGETRHGAGYRGAGGKKPSTTIVSAPFLPFYANPLECFKRSGQTGFRPYFPST